MNLPECTCFKWNRSRAAHLHVYKYAQTHAHTQANTHMLHTYLQLEPKDLAEQLKRGGAAVPAIRPGKQTAEYVTNTLTRMSLLGSVFLGE